VLAVAGGVPGAGAQQAPQSGAAAAKAEASKSKSPAPKSPSGKAAAKKPPADPTAAQGEVEAGVNALAQGKADAAVVSLTNAISAGSLPQAQTARALYYRGVAHRRLGKPALAISDLTSALWIKSGLTEEQRADALLQRSGAYREAGLPDQSDPQAGRTAAAAKGGSTATPFAAVAPAAPSGSSTSLSGSGGGFFSSLFGGGSTQQPSAPASTTPNAPPAAPATTASVAVRAPAATGQPAGSAAQTATSSNKPATRIVPVLTSDSSLPMGFQDMGGGFRHVEVSTQARAAAPQPPPPAKEWESTTKVKQGPAQAARPASKEASAPAKATQVAAAPQAAASATRPANKAAGGPVSGATAGVRLQVAAVRTAEEAKGISQRLQSQFARELGGRAPVVDQVSAGNFGNFYRVQVGPFAAGPETDELCGKLKSGGLDCRIVSQ
jgi:hypothetical protein